MKEMTFKVTVDFEADKIVKIATVLSELKEKGIIKDYVGGEIK